LRAGDHLRFAIRRDKNLIIKHFGRAAKHNNRIPIQ
jgi:hypothetical protein